MTSDEFNEKWGKYLEDGYYGMAIEDEEVIKYLDEEFAKEVQVNPDFSYSQIKLKFGSSRIYVNSGKAYNWEDQVNKILNEL